MTEMSTWREVKDRAQRIDPHRDSSERVADRSRIREELLSRVNGARLAEIRRSVGMTQVQLAETTGLTQARISQIENGDSVGLDTLRTYITGLGGQVDVVARVGTVRLNIA